MATCSSRASSVRCWAPRRAGAGSYGAPCSPRRSRSGSTCCSSSWTSCRRPCRSRSRCSCQWRGRGGLDRGWRLDLTLGSRDASPLDLAYLGNELVVERADRLVVSADRRVELTAGPGEVVGERGQTAVQLARGLRDLAGGLGDPLLAPAVVHGAQ